MPDHPDPTRVDADERDAEYAAAILDDGSIDPAWLTANTRIRGRIKLMPDFPRVLTPADLDRLSDNPAVGREWLERARLQMHLDAHRYPLTFARLEETHPDRRTLSASRAA